MHIISVICWFSGIFYLPRLFVNYAMATDLNTSKQLQMMAHKLYRFVSIFAVLTIIFGLWLVSYNWDYYLHATWFIYKFILIVLLLIYHFVCGHYVKLLKLNQNPHSHLFYRVFNEIPVLILFPIIILVVVKPFN